MALTDVQMKRAQTLKAAGASVRSIARTLGVSYSLVRYAFDPERRNASRKAWYARNVEEARRRAKAWRDKNPGYDRKFRLPKKYGVTVAQVEARFIQVGGACEICRCQMSLGDLKKTKACVDHNHATGQVRGLLCSACNSGLGAFGDSISRLDAAAAYLRHFGGQA